MDVSRRGFRRRAGWRAAREALAVSGRPRGRGIEGSDRGGTRIPRCLRNAMHVRELHVAAPATCGGFGGLKGIVEADETYVRRKGARGWTQGTAAGRQGEEARSRGRCRMAADRSGTTVSAVLPRVDAAALTAALDPVVAKDALLVSDGGASYPCAAAPSTARTGSGRSARRPQPVEGLPASPPRATRYLDN